MCISTVNQHNSEMIQCRNLKKTRNKKNGMSDDH